jgi:molybdopterin-dependent oxidoreductase alpha subunit
MQEDHAAGLKAVTVAINGGLRKMGPVRTARTLLRINQVDGFDCMSCAWPDPLHRHQAEFCENGAKAVAEEAHTARVDAAFFRRHSLKDLDTRDEYWLGKQGRLTRPMVKRAGDTHYRPIAWEDAFDLIAKHLNDVDPDEVTFYTSGRASNEAAYCYQLFARAYGTNNLPDCSNMCHESTSVALGDAIGVAKGSVLLEDIHNASVIVLAGQNPGTNHPRMLSALEVAKDRGATIITINPPDEAGSSNFRNPQRLSGVLGKGTDLTDLQIPVRINGDLALFQAFGHLLVLYDAVNAAFVQDHTQAFEAWAEARRKLDWDDTERRTGLNRSDIERAATYLAEADGVVWCWAMGLTQHHNSVPTIRESVNLALARGDIGRPGAGLCPVRGHSNVQGDRTVGIWEGPPEEFLDRLANHHGFEPPRKHGLDTVDAIHAFSQGRAKVFVGLGGNFVSAAPDTEFTSAALRRADLTVQISTKLNRSHVVCGKTALILPTLGRTERDIRDSGPQFVTVEDSMSVVHSSRGRLLPASAHLRSEVAIVCELAERTLGSECTIPWGAYSSDYSSIRRAIEEVIPGFESFEPRVRGSAGFVLPHPPRDTRTFPTASGRAAFSDEPVTSVEVPEGCMVLQTLRSHDQFNTTIYRLDDRYRGVKSGRRVVFLNRDDIEAHGLRVGERVDLIGVGQADGGERVVRGMRVIEYKTPRGTAAAYYPETNPLVPITSTAVGSNTPTSKSVVVRLARSRVPETAR